MDREIRFPDSSAAVDSDLCGGKGYPTFEQPEPDVQSKQRFNSQDRKTYYTSFLSKTSQCMLYYSLIYPYFYYRNQVWASTYKTNPRSIF